MQQFAGSGLDSARDSADGSPRIGKQSRIQTLHSTSVMRSSLFRPSADVSEHLAGVSRRTDWRHNPILKRTDCL